MSTELLTLPCPWEDLVSSCMCMLQLDMEWQPSGFQRVVLG